MKNTFWAQASDIGLSVAPNCASGFDFGYDAAVPESMRACLEDFMGWVEETFTLPVTLWVDFEYKHYLVSREGKRVGYLFYWNDVSTWPVLEDEEATPIIRLPVRDDRWTLHEILASFIEGITDYYAWLCRTVLSVEEKERTVETILAAYWVASHG